MSVGKNAGNILIVDAQEIEEKEMELVDYRSKSAADDDEIEFLCALVKEQRHRLDEYEARIETFVVEQQYNIRIHGNDIGHEINLLTRPQVKG